jgi:hypothetical protein
MDWIEKIFGWNPDNGDGSVEFLMVSLAVIAATIGVTITAMRRNRRLSKN